MILFDSHKTSVFTSGATVRLRGHSIILGDSYKVILNFFYELLESLSLFTRNKRMEITESLPSNWNHANSRVELHSARPKRNHGVSQT